MEPGKASDSSLGLKGLAISEQHAATPSDEHGDGPSPGRVEERFQLAVLPPYQVSIIVPALCFSDRSVSVDSGLYFKLD